jgi:hypothetical protein
MCRSIDKKQAAEEGKEYDTDEEDEFDELENRDFLPNPYA